MSDEDTRKPADEAPEDGTLIDTEFSGDAVYEPPASEPTVSVDPREEGGVDERADDGDSEAAADPEPEPPVDEDSTVMVDMEGTGEEEEEDNAKTQLIESPFADEPAPAAPEPPEPEARLVVTFGNDGGKEFPVTGDVVVIGRSLDADIVLNDPSVSRKHFEIHLVDGGWLLKDLGSVNGTKLDGERIDGQAPLVEGAKIEAGQTLMEFGCDEDKTRVLEIPDEQEPDEATVISEPPKVASVNMQSSPEIMVSEAGEGEGRKKFPAIVIVAAAAALVVAALAVAQFGFGLRIVPIGPDPEVEKARIAEAEAARVKVEARDLNALGLVAFQSREWDRASKMFQRSFELDPTVEGLKDNIERSKAEAKNSETLAKGKKLLKAGDVAAATEALGSVPESSVYYPEARQALDSTAGVEIEKDIGRIRDSLKAGKKDEARDGYLDLLERHPDDDAVIELRDELVASGLRLDPVRRKASKHPSPAPKSATSTGWKSPPAGRGHVKSGSGPRLDIASALRLYEKGSFQEAAVQVLAISKRSRGSEAKRLKSIAHSIEQFATAYMGGKSALLSKRLDKAEQGLGLALRLDHRINGFYEPKIRGYLGDTYRGRAAAAIQNTDYVLAAKSARKALSYRPDDHMARTIMDKCLSVAKKYYEQAAADIQNGDKGPARQKLKMVLDMVPSSHQLADKASDLMKKTR